LKINFSEIKKIVKNKRVFYLVLKVRKKGQKVLSEGSFDVNEFADDLSE
jgi:hypothetical protein